MKIISKGNILSVLIVNSKFIEIDKINIYIKELVIKLRGKYGKDLYGFYKVDVYLNKRIGTIIDFCLEEDLDFLRDLLDLNVVIHKDVDMFFKFSDYFLFDCKKIYFFDGYYYVNVDDVSDNEFLEKIEFCNTIYGNELSNIKNNFKKICFV